MKNKNYIKFYNLTKLQIENEFKYCMIIAKKF